MAAVWSVEGELSAMLRHILCATSPATQDTLFTSRFRTHGLDNLQSHPFLLIFVSREPNGEEATSTERRHNSVATGIEPVAQVNRMKAP